MLASNDCHILTADLRGEENKGTCLAYGGDKRRGHSPFWERSHGVTLIDMQKDLDKGLYRDFLKAR